MDAATRRVLFFSLVGLLVATSTIAVLQVAPLIPKPPEYGTISIYLASTPSDISSDQNVASTSSFAMTPPATTSASAKSSENVTSLTVTISTVLIHVTGEGNDTWIPISKGSITLDLLRATSGSTLLASIQLPHGNITMVRLVISSAIAIVKGPSGQTKTVNVTVSSGKLEIPIRGSAIVKGQMITSITLGRPHIVREGNGQIRLTPDLNSTVTGPE